jgi:GT2 family glycosyltransferase
MSASLPRLGVVVLNWNGLDHLPSCLDSLRESDHPDFFVLVVDNGSVDGSVAWLKERRDVELLPLDENLRFAGGNNAGAARAIELGARHLLILNNDTTVEREALRELGGALAGGTCDVVGPQIVYASAPDRIWFGGGIFHAAWGFVAHRDIRRPISAGRSMPGPTDWVTGCALAIGTDLWQQLGGLDEGYYIYSEDVDLCLRARDAGGRIAYWPAARIRHAVSATVGSSGSAFKAYHRTRARRRLLRRHGRGPFWPVSLLTLDLATAGWEFLRGHVAAAKAILLAVGERESSPVRFLAEELAPEGPPEEERVDG